MHILEDSAASLAHNERFDLAVVGAGGAGLAAALFAALGGCKVLLIERTGFVGGTTALSAGTTWIPGSRHAATVNPQDTLAEAARYLDNAIGDRAPPALRQAFLAHGAAAVNLLETRTAVRFRPYARQPDYIPDLGGATLNGRALEPLPFDGRLLGRLFRLVRPPIPEFTVLGGMMVDRTDINHLLGMGRSFASLRHSLRILARHATDRVRYPRGTRLVLGNALVGRLLYSLSMQKNVTLMLNATVEELERSARGIDALTLLQGQRRSRVTLTGGVVLASGGFNRHPRLRSTMLPGIDPAWCPGAPGHTGQAHDLVRPMGAHYGTGSLSHAFWAPVSLRLRADGSQAVFPHFVMDRARPGMLTVNRAGERFASEGSSCHLFALAMQQSPAGKTAGEVTAPAIPAYLICDAEALRKYGIGMVRPGGKGLSPFLADSYLTQGSTIEELAGRLGLSPAALAASVAKLNACVQSGVDPELSRGVTACQRNIGDPDWPGRNPNLGRLVQPPFYAVRLYPGDIGAATGFETDEQARVTDTKGEPIPGLYAVGNDMHSIMGGVCTAPGITIGPGIVFACIAARDATQRAAEAGGLMGKASPRVQWP